MAVPKRKTSKSVRGKRRTHKKVAGISVSSCPSCGEPKLPHRICLECKSYKDSVITDKESS